MNNHQAVNWSNYDFTSHLNDHVDSSDVLDETTLRSNVFQTFLAHYDRQDICEVDERTPESDAVKKLIHKKLMSNKNFVPQNNLDDNGELIKSADEKTTNLLFQLTLMVDYEANLHRLAEFYSHHNPKLYGFIFKAIEKFFVDMSSASLTFVEKEDAKPLLNITAFDDVPKTMPLAIADKTDVVTKRSTKKVVMKRKSRKPSSVTIKKKAKAKSTAGAETPKRQTPKRKCVKEKIVEDSTSDDGTSRDSDSSDGRPNTEDEIPTTYVKKELLKDFITKEPRKTMYGENGRRLLTRVKCTFEGCSRMVINKPCVLEQHMRMHTGEKIFKCDECGKAYTAKQTLQIHLRIHRGERPYPCDVCGKNFSGRTSLQVHMNTHTGEKPFMCETCGKRFTSQGALRNHNVRHGGTRKPDKKVKCTFEGCNKMIIDMPSKIGVHMRMHTGEKPFQCDVCGERFSQGGRLTGHKRIHTGERPFACDQCDKTFRLQKMLQNHKVLHTGEKPHKCKVCGTCFSHSGTLSNHMRVHGGGKKDYVAKPGRPSKYKPPTTSKESSSSSEVPNIPFPTLGFPHAEPVLGHQHGHFSQFQY